MAHRRLLGIVALACFFVSCAPLQEQSYLQQYGNKGAVRGLRNPPYRVSQEVHTCVQGKISGRITRLQAETFSPDLEPGLGMDVQTLDRGLVHVHLGPLWFLDRQETDLKPGEEVTIQAFCYKLEGQERLLADEIKHKDHTLVLRDPQGRPYWEAWLKN